ncbi:hypothetical protein jhhlp_000884 [Lomentospora prolificans]|uniref:USP domain-containing protein n=1 Tax=Lomentospora prolificans TaxID=41688 RepID=A0A2N3NJP8_9PEZI|nr:hypothetical protein jhhlp_000884 [Lomentospora prolificans]
MDQAPSSPEARDRAVSTEPPSTRPNPFDDDDSSRKRRRTSLSGSRSLSVDTVQSPHDETAHPPVLAEPVSDTHDSAIMDTDPSTPQTPEQKGSSNPDYPAEPGSSRVTINLRNANLSSSTAASPTPHTLEDPALPDGVKLSVELPDRDMKGDLLVGGHSQTAVMGPAPAIPVTTLSDSGSPDIEVIDVPEDDADVVIGDGEPEVSIIGESRAVLEDPTLDFPYNDGEPLIETVSRLANYISGQHQLEESLFESLQSWADLFIRWAETAGYQIAYHSCLENAGLWQSFPDLVWAACNRALGRTATPRQAISSFYLTFARLTGFFVTLDCQTLASAAGELGGLDSGQIPETFSYAFLTSLHGLTRRDEPRILNGPDSQTGWLRPDLISELVQGFQTMPGGSIQTLTRLVESQIRLMERFPRLVDQPAAVCQVVSDLVWESNRRLHFAGQPQQVLEQCKQRLFQGHKFYHIVSKSLSDTIHKLVNHLTTDGASGQIISLTDIYHCALHGDHKMATEMLAAHHRSYPNLPTHLAPGAIAWEWRFNMFGKLIMSGQMQLRVWAVGHMCSDLVMFWRRCGDGQEDLALFLAYFAEYLMRTKLVEYILGPTCHPEITIESGNVVGFLLVTKFYQKEQTDLLWQTITSSQDRRVADALTRMAANITHLCDQEHLLYFCEKLELLPIESFNMASIRHFCEQVFKQLMSKTQGERQLLNFLPYELCLRLLRESSVCSAQSQVAYPEIQAFATQKLRELHHHGPDSEGRKRLYLTCIEDIAAKSPTTLGSLCGLFISIRHALGLELQVLTAEHNLSSLLVDELEHAISLCNQTEGLYVLTGASNSPRRDFIYSLICYEPDSLTAELGKRLWDMMVGPDSASAEDRASGWHILNDAAAQAGFDTSFMSSCLSVHFPTLPADCFSEGALRFLKDEIVPRLNSSMISLDNTESVKQSGIEELWRMILTAPDQAVSDAAIDVLVKDIYIGSRAILDYPHYRARQVHLGLVNRCLDQLSEAAKKLTLFNESSTGGEDESMVIVASDEQVLEQERMFIRSLAVLRQFLQAHQSKAHFATADLRPLMPPSPTTVVGESAELKFQSFDGDKQTDVRPLNIGKRNTAASLLASLREATGFENYRIYYKGQVFVPNENEVCRSLEDLRIHDGLILVKREEDGVSPSSRMRPGVSPLEIAILSHFGELWGYLSLEEKFAQEIYQFLVKLPADSHILEVLDSNSTPYLELFPLGQPFKCLYAIYALVEYTDAARRRRKTSLPSFEGDGTSNPYKEAMERVLMLIFAAISDPDVIDKCPTGHLKSQLSLQLMNCLVDLLTTWQMSVTSQEMDWADKAPPLDRLLTILREAHSTPKDAHSLRLIPATFTAILLLCVVSAGYWDELTKTDAFGSLTQELLLDPKFAIRDKISQIIKDACLDEQRLNVKMAEFLWPYISGIVPKLVEHPASCNEGFELTEFLILRLLPKLSPVLDLAQLADQCCNLLLELSSSEDVCDPDPDDYVVGGLVRLLHCCIELDKSIADPANKLFRRGTARDLLWRYLFPTSKELDEPPSTVLLNRNSRERLYNIIFELVIRDEEQFRWLLEDLKKLVPFDKNEDDPYHYDLPLQFERSKAIRSPCGYVGLRNLSNTCYLNSLFTQLFMNTNFRRFILSASIVDPPNQKLLYQTQKLFAFMQESIRRFVDPYLVVGSIKTYDDTLIDIHNQMDVDEFYNLLFDRWEYQLPNPDDRKVLRSFYGGQLVQQVKSNECEHVSERLEPFSAIQCDIKGKGTLQDSLQAYVGGEIMEGDNKYKCSTCDRHVDAVKRLVWFRKLSCDWCLTHESRACLKDIPDNLIFHLKRFDFNLRTMQRSKINDYFSFPAKIDMRPYTIDYLSDPDTPGREDIFELVGILVHSGTAESGHYYSYIRERPSSSNGETWVEFNDDLVSPWDPETMETSTFGGPDFRYDSNGIVYDKNYSAYMLFYQRSSTLQVEEESLTIPLKVDIPSDILDHIRNENTYILQRHCLYDPNHATFVRRIFEQCAVRRKVCTAEHKVEKIAMYVALGHLDQVVSRTKDVPDFGDYFDMLLKAVNKCPNCALSLFKYFRGRHESFRALIQRNPEPVVRVDCGELLMAAVERIKKDLPEVYGNTENALDHDHMEGWAHTLDSVIAQVPLIFDTLWFAFQIHLRAWNEVFAVMLRFARLGELETILLLNSDFLSRLLRIIQADSSLDLAPNYQRMMTNVLRRGLNRPPSYENIITLADHLMSVLQPILSSESIVEKADNRLLMYLHGEAAPPWTSLEVFTVHQEWATSPGSSVFVSKLLEINQAPQASDNIIQRLVQANRQLGIKVFQTLRANITGQMLQGHSNAPYLRAAVAYCKAVDEDEPVLRMLIHVAAQCRQLNNTEGRAFLDFFCNMYGTPGPNSGLSHWSIFFNMTAQIPKWTPYLLGYYDGEVRWQTEEFIQKSIFDYGASPAFEEGEGGERRKEVLVSAAREIGFNCLIYLRDHFIQRRVHVAKDMVLPLQRVVARASAYFNPEPEEPGPDHDFAQLSQTILDAMKRITVDELEEDGSEWDNSCGSSGGDIETFDTLADADLQ